MKDPQRLVVLAFTLFDLTRGLTSFGKPPFIRRQHHVATTRHISLDNLSDFIAEDEDNQSTSKESSVQLWLDLRGTAIHPKAAIDYLEEQLYDDSDDVSDLSLSFDKIFVSDNRFQKLLTSSDSFLEESEILYIPSESPSLLALSRGGMSFPFGDMLSFDDSAAVADPVTALDSLSSGKWVFLCNGDDSTKDEEASIAAVSSFLDIASTASDWGSANELESGLLVRTSDFEEEESEIGGVAVQCQTRSSIMQLASTIKSLGSGKSTTRTDSGLLIQQDSESSPLPVALIIPFDISLWKVALLVYGREEEE